ncbi:L-seryl-tRNA(Sec) selenium transferase [Sulfurovum sp. ST-21]|uniref:L-seryl-tRNA(Sec) selenium transferase n=1 Tax=Sulfurovum indicum TaxID=2779528 RepID=A0A7M1S2N4_9BACT|nr:L-seryl-tRNA(Sec) selenium transferase [Sulfurovum indicum]QOR61271.1 L-seryl-tRNA(Sec) selenium transferase [Sulfurovum indicum]
MQLLQQIPKVDKLIFHDTFTGLNHTLLTSIIRDHIDTLRKKILNKEIERVDESVLIKEIKEGYAAALSPSLRPLINATGVILHTNMGRSLISKEILERASYVICNYSNLEYDQEKGCRGERYEHVSGHLKRLLGVEDVIVVNNNASAVFLVLNTFAKNKEVIVSRGELVEIGGSFRIPEVMSQSGALLKEVGATNKTKLSDYKNAICDNSAMLMKVHQSNFTIEGFSEDVDFADIRALAEEHELLDYYDLGSGYIAPLPYNLANRELPLGKILELNPSLISFSGDKLFGSVQAGIIAGKRELIARLKKNQLLRMLRVDKITLSILEETIKAYLEEKYDLIPTLKMLFVDVEVLKQRAEEMREKVGCDKCEVIETKTVMGGGTLPNKEFPSIALYIKGKATRLEKAFREKGVIGRIEENCFLLDFRTVQEELENELCQIIKEIVV